MKFFKSLIVFFLFASTAVSAAPSLKYYNAGTLSSWTEESYYNSPVICDIDGDGNDEIIFSNYSITVLDAKTGNVKWKVNSGHDRNENFFEFGKSVGHTWCDAVVKDIDADGKKEIISSLIMCNRKYAPVYPPTEYMSICILNADRTRFKNEFLDTDWTTIPTDLGKPLVQNTVSIASGVCQTPVVSDIDGDGKNEILFNSYNGKLHCFSLNKTEPYAWPYSLTRRTSPLFEYASPPVCVDIDFDGKQEIIFASSYDETQPLPSVMQASLYILNYEGRLISKTPLPPAKEAQNKHNGVKSAPQVKDIDGDGRYEVVLNTANGAICVYDL